MPHPRRDRLLLAGVLIVAAGLRAWRLGQGLPDFVEEAIPLRRALEMGGWQASRLDLNPHFFNYPSLVIYLQLALVRLQVWLGALTGRLAEPADFWVLFQTDPTGPAMVARAVGILADLAACYGTWRLAERLRPGTGPAAAAAVALSATMIRTSRLIFVDPVLGALTIWTCERLVAWQIEGGRRRLTAAVVLIGLAAGAKYQGGLLVLPLAWALWARDGTRGLARWLLLALASAGVFVATTPYTLLDPRAFWAGLDFERRHMAAGHFGVRDTTGAGFAGWLLLRDLGPVILVLAAAGIARSLRGRRQAATTVVVALALLGLTVAGARMQAERYLVPLVPLLAVVAAVALRSAARPRLVAVITIAALAPVAWQGARAAYAGRDHTQIQARRWVEAHIDPRASLLVLEPYTARLRNRFDDDEIFGHPAWAQASPAARARYMAEPRYCAAALPVMVSGGVTVTAVDQATGRSRILDVFSHAADANALYYEPALLVGATHVLVSSAVSARHLAEPARYPAQVAFYALLARHAESVAVFRPGAGVDGPQVTVYRLGDAFARAVAGGRPLQLDPFWWTRSVPAEFKVRYQEVAVAPDRRCGEDLRCPNGNVAPWVVGLREPFRSIVKPLLGRLAASCMLLGRWDAAQQLALPLLLMEPEDPRSIDIYVQVAIERGDLRAAEQALQRGLHFAGAREREHYRLALAQVLRACRRSPEAADLLNQVLRGTAASDSLHLQAVAMLDEMARE